VHLPTLVLPALTLQPFLRQDLYAADQWWPIANPSNLRAH
jgi:hypothetical protein